MSENTKFNKSDLSGYKLDRRCFPDGWGDSLPAHWTPGGFYYSINEQGLFQNIETDSRLPARWQLVASTLERAEGLILALGGSS